MFCSSVQFLGNEWPRHQGTTTAHSSYTALSNSPIQFQLKTHDGIGICISCGRVPCKQCAKAGQFKRPPIQLGLIMLYCATGACSHCYCLLGKRPPTQVVAALCYPGASAAPFRTTDGNTTNRYLNWPCNSTIYNKSHSSSQGSWQAKTVPRLPWDCGNAESSVFSETPVVSSSSCMVKASQAWACEYFCSRTTAVPSRQESAAPPF